MPKILEKTKKTNGHFIPVNNSMTGNRITPILTQNLMLIPNLKSEFRKNLKKIPKTKKHDLCSVYYDRYSDPKKIKIFFRVQHYRNTQKK